MIWKKIGKIGYENITINGLKQLEGGDICCECDADNEVVCLFFNLRHIIVRSAGRGKGGE